MGKCRSWYTKITRSEITNRFNKYKHTEPDDEKVDITLLNELMKQELS